MAKKAFEGKEWIETATIAVAAQRQADVRFGPIVPEKSRLPTVYRNIQVPESRADEYSLIIVKLDKEEGDTEDQYMIRTIAKNKGKKPTIMGPLYENTMAFVLWEHLKNRL